MGGGGGLFRVGYVEILRGGVGGDGVDGWMDG